MSTIIDEAAYFKVKLEELADKVDDQVCKLMDVYLLYCALSASICTEGVTEIFSLLDVSSKYDDPDSFTFASNGIRQEGLVLLWFTLEYAKKNIVLMWLP